MCWKSWTEIILTHFWAFKVETMAWKHKFKSLLYPNSYVCTQAQEESRIVTFAWIIWLLSLFVSKHRFPFSWYNTQCGISQPHMSYTTLYLTSLYLQGTEVTDITVCLLLFFQLVLCTFTGITLYQPHFLKHFLCEIPLCSLSLSLKVSHKHRTSHVFTVPASLFNPAILCLPHLIPCFWHNLCRCHSIRIEKPLNSFNTEAAFTARVWKKPSESREGYADSYSIKVMCWCFWSISFTSVFRVPTLAWWDTDAVLLPSADYSL